MKIIIDILKGYIPSLIFSGYKLLSKSKLFRSVTWVTSNCLRTSVYVLPAVGLCCWWYYAGIQPIYKIADDFIWESGIVEYLNISSQQAADRLIYASFAWVTVSLLLIFWRVSYKYKRRNIRLREMTFERVAEESQHSALLGIRLLQSAINLSPNIVLIVDADFYINYCNKGYFNFSNRYNLDLPYPIGQTLFSVIYFLPIKKQIVSAFNLGEKTSFCTNTFIGYCDIDFEIILLPVGNGGVSNVIIYIIPQKTCDDVKKENENESEKNDRS